MTGPETERLVVVEIAHPGYRPLSAEIAIPVGAVPGSLDDLAIETHQLVNELVQAIRKEGPV